MADVPLPDRPVAVSQHFSVNNCDAKNGGNLSQTAGVGRLQNQPKGEFA
jgi:hypothetical protein